MERNSALKRPLLAAVGAVTAVELATAILVSVVAGTVWTGRAASVAVAACPERALVFAAGFTDSTQWTVGRSSAYPHNGPTNRADAKLDWIAPTNRPDTAGVFGANRRPDGYWNTDLVTTEYSAAGFRVRTGDTVTAIVTLPRQTDQGAWPAIWTWGSGASPGHGEVDLFEWHPDHPQMVEFANHVGGGYRYVDRLIQPGVPFDLQVDLSAAGVVWWVNGVRVYTGGGLPAGWSAYLIVNLSVSDGTWHPAPASTATRLSYRVNALRVWR